MMPISSVSLHTKLINILISLCRRTPDCEPALENVGYTLDRIGLRIKNPDFSPDLTVRNSQKNHLLFFECKSGNIDNEQAKKYKELTPDLISERGITTLPAEGLSFEVCYVCLDKAKALENESRYHWGFPILIFENNLLKKEPSTNAFQDKELDELFSKGILFKGEPTYEHYPFGEDDKKSVIVYNILYAMSVILLEKNRFSEKELMRKSHPLFEYMGQDAKIWLSKVTHHALAELKKRSLKFTVRDVADKIWEVREFSFSKSISKYLKEVAESFDKKSDEYITKWMPKKKSPKKKKTRKKK